MADFRRSEDEANDEHGNKQSSLPVTGADTPTLQPILPLRFANRVAISLRTPTLYYRSFFLLSIAITPPLQSPAYLSDNRQMKKNTGIKERHLLWIGTWGSWSEVMLIPLYMEWVWRVVKRGAKEKSRKRASVDKPGVFEIRSVAPKEEPTTPNHKVSLSPAAAKHLRRSDSSTNIPDVLPLHSRPPSPTSRPPSLVNLVSPPSPAPEIASPLINSLKAELAAAQSVVQELQNQLSAHDQSVHEAHAHLQSTLDDLRTRRKEDDAERQELKARTKNLEEQKRQAESARREAEKKLRAVEVVRDGLENKIKSAEGSVKGTREQIGGSQQSVKVLQEEGDRHAVGARQEVERKQQEMRHMEAEIGTVEAKNEELESRVKEAEEKLKGVVEAGEAARKIGPEEEMMMMAAAYEVAAQEGYLHGYQHAHGGNSQWATQAAAYMAEAGMPHLGYDYTARPTSHVSTTGFGHLSKGTFASSSSRDLKELRYTDMSGFEDFGPGSASVSRRVSGVNAGKKQESTASDSESDVYGHDPGSPNGGISSSFSANLLPQGLFSSLEGETPYIGSGDDSTTFDDPLKLDLGGQDVQADNSSSSSASSPQQPPASSHHSSFSNPVTTHVEPIKRPSGNASHSLLPYPSSTSPSSGPNGLAPPTHSTTPPLIPGLPTLPGSRRWFSGTLSNDSLPNKSTSSFSASGFPSGITQLAYHHPTTTASNDSLHMGVGSSGAGGYESPFAPTEGEKKALAMAQGKWGGLSKRWTGGGEGWPSGLGWGRRDVGVVEGRASSEGHRMEIGQVLGQSSQGEVRQGEEGDKPGLRSKFSFLRKSQNQLSESRS
ncbi:hypothetical protein CNBG_2761 [Cryptococcus deuterogattii R265]|nr:hypothetical protein CNBG_2761 [Cryptococcus deuterogattii R265]